MVEIADLGVLDGDILLFGGPYSNLQAAQALFAQAGHIPREQRICTGDLVAYCADPLETAELILAQTAHVIAGNCEKQLAEGAQDCGCGFEEGTACDLASRGWYPYAQQRLGTLGPRFAALPDFAVFEHAGRRYGVLHGGVSDISRFLWPSDGAEVLLAEIAALEALAGPVDGVIAGHSGIPFERELGGKLWINAGVIGMPPHDGRPETRYAVLSADGVRFHSLEYDHESAAQALEAAGLTQGYEASLRTGIWPSEDVLPPDLRR